MQDFTCRRSFKASTPKWERLCARGNDSVSRVMSPDFPCALILCPPTHTTYTRTHTHTRVHTHAPRSRTLAQALPFNVSDSNAFDALGAAHYLCEPVIAHDDVVGTAQHAAFTALLHIRLTLCALHVCVRAAEAEGHLPSHQAHAPGLPSRQRRLTFVARR
jgi:hypothetical protein